MKQIFLQQTVNYMFQVDLEGSQKMFESIGEPEVKEIEFKDDLIIRYYVFEDQNEKDNL